MRCEDESMGGRCSYSIPHPSPFTHGPPNVSSVQTQRGVAHVTASVVRVKKLRPLLKINHPRS